jgi:uncharacterized protein with PIN domain
LKFVADSMLGKLAKWLRILGYDTHYQSYYRPGVMDQLLIEDRCLLSRYREAANQYRNTVLLNADRVGAQLHELRAKIEDFRPDRSNWFSRCLACNTVLKEAPRGEARDNVPEYVFYNNMLEIRRCPSCRRYYWPGSHRTRMVNQLEEWGFI